MSFINYNSKEIYCKIIYAGPPKSGKTTNIQWLYKKTAEQSENSELLHLPLESSPTVLFDFLPLSIGKVRDFSTRLHLYTIPGEELFKSTGKIILKGLDGIVFVADSNPSRMEKNTESLNQLKMQLEDEGYELKKTPLVIQYNKRDLSTAEPVFRLKQVLNYYNSPDVEAIAINGKGVFDTLKIISRLVVTVLKGGELQ